jgi:predicted transposase YbfD/YdcC
MCGIVGTITSNEKSNVITAIHKMLDWLDVDGHIVTIDAMGCQYAIADQIIAGGSTVVQKVNTLVASVENVASLVGTQGAKLFYDAGLTQGQALVDGIRQAITDAAAEIAALASSLGSVTIVPPVTNTLVDEPKPIQNIKEPTVTQLTRTEKIVKAAGGAQSTAASRHYTAMAAAMGRIRLADGGIVMGPTNALIGEAGPEAVIPLSGTNSPKMGTTYNITVNAGIGTNGAQVGREIVDAIKKFERTSGPVFASA